MKISIKTKDQKVFNTHGNSYEFESEIDFWRFFVRMMTYLKNQELSDPQVEMLAFILSGSPYASYFRKPFAKQLMEHLGVKSYQSLYNNRIVLEKYGFLEYTGEVRGDYLIQRNLREVQKLVKKLVMEDNLESIDIGFLINLNIPEDERKREYY